MTRLRSAACLLLAVDRSLRGACRGRPGDPVRGRCVDLRGTEPRQRRGTRGAHHPRAAGRPVVLRAVRPRPDHGRVPDGGRAVGTRANDDVAVWPGDDHGGQPAADLAVPRLSRGAGSRLDASARDAVHPDVRRAHLARKGLPVARAERKGVARDVRPAHHDHGRRGDQPRPGVSRGRHRRRAGGQRTGHGPGIGRQARGRRARGHFAGNDPPLAGRAERHAHPGIGLPQRSLQGHQRARCGRVSRREPPRETPRHPAAIQRAREFRLPSCHRRAALLLPLLLG